MRSHPFFKVWVVWSYRFLPLETHVTPVSGYPKRKEVFAQYQCSDVFAGILFIILRSFFLYEIPIGH